MAEPTHSLPRRIWRLLVACLALLGLLVVVVTITPLTSWWAGKLASPWNDPKGDNLIVLSGSNGSEGMIGYGTYLRCEYAVLAWREGGFKHVIVTGASASGSPQAVQMKDFLVSQGVPADVIIVEPQATSTRENALYTKPIIQSLGGTNVVLTSDYHSYRAIRTFRKLGINAEPRPFPDVRKRSTSWLGRWPAFQDLCVESIKIAYYRLRRWI